MATPATARSALVAGASGLVGSHVLRLLLAEPAYERVTALVRRELPQRHPNLVQRVVDFDRLAELGDFPRVDDVFCCLGSTIRRAGSQEAFRRVDFTYVHALARVASRHRAARFLLVSSLGAAPGSRVLGGCRTIAHPATPRRFSASRFENPWRLTSAPLIASTAVSTTAMSPVSSQLIQPMMSGGRWRS